MGGLWGWVPGWLRRRLKWVAAALSVLIAVSIVWAGLPNKRDIEFIIGKYKEPMPTPTPAPRPAPFPVPMPVPDGYMDGGPVYSPRPVLKASGRAPGPARPFKSTFKVPSDLRFFLVIGSDARPGEDMQRARADSIHIAAVDPASKEGTILGLPRDSYVDIPGHGKRKINAALPLGGPDLLVRTVRMLTRLPVSYYAVTGFQGMVRMVDELKGVDIYVPYEMRDRYSGAYFSKGWHDMDGPQVLAFSRCRYGVPGGDFGRSENHGRVMKHTLTKLRAETSNSAGIQRWMKVLYKHSKLNMSFRDAMKLGSLARQIVPADLRNVVAPGDVRTIGGQSVVVLGDEAKRLFTDVAADAVADGDLKRQKPDPTPKPKPKPTPTPGIVPPPVETLLPKV